MADNKRYYWMKFQRDFFDSKRIKKLRKLAGGDTFTIIYLKMQLLSIEKNGILEYTGLENSFAEEIALDIDEDPDNVLVTMNYLMSVGLLDLMENGEYVLPYARDNIGSETASTKRSRVCRDKKKALQCNTDATQMQRNRCNATTLQRSCSVEKEKEKEKDIERRGTSQGTMSPDLLTTLVDKWNNIGYKIPPIKAINEGTKRYQQLVELLASYGDKVILDAIDMVAVNDFLKGDNPRGWIIDFDWFVNKKNFPKIIENKYQKWEPAKKDSAKPLVDPKRRELYEKYFPA